MDFLSFILKELLWVIPVLWFLGWSLKQVPQIKNQYIPFILIFIGILFAGFFKGWTAFNVGQGIMLAGLAVLGNQVVKQSAELKVQSDELKEQSGNTTDEAGE
jgi:hypothetical protein